MKVIFATCLTLIALLLFCGCKMYSWMVLENPEFPDAMLPTELKADVLNKYTVGDVIVHPRILYVDGAMTTQRLVVMCFSKTNTAAVTINNLILSVNGVKQKYGNQIVNVSMSDWEMYPANSPFYVCGIHGESINLPKEELIKSKVEISLTVLVKKENGRVVEKTIDAYFLPKKRSYLE